MSTVVLDASAVLAMLRDEPGGDLVAKVIGNARFNAVNHAEVVGYFVHAGMPAEAVEAMLHPLPLEVIAADRETASIAGMLRAATADAGLSLGDRFCLAQARRDGLPAWTADRAWADLAFDVGVEIILIR